MNSNTYPPMISLDPESGSSGGALRMFDSPYSAYSSHASPYPDYPLSSKLEAFDYAYWPATTTHNLLANPAHAVLDQIQTPPSSSQAIETLLPLSPVHLSQISNTATISSTHHHHHIHQHVYPPAPPPILTSTPPTAHDPSQWLGSGDYQALNSSSNPAQYRHYSTPCSFYPTNNFYEASSSQWPTSSALPIKFESPGSPPSYIESSNSIHQFPEHNSKDEQSDPSYQYYWPKPSSSSQLPPVPPRNPLNGKTRTREKYRIVYTDQQRYELENEFMVSKYISIPRKSALSVTLALSERQIKIWFQNRRAKERKLTKKRHEISTRQFNNSNDDDSPSDAGLESPNVYQTYA